MELPDSFSFLSVVLLATAAASASAPSSPAGDNTRQQPWLGSGLTRQCLSQTETTIVQLTHSLHRPPSSTKECVLQLGIVMTNMSRDNATGVTLELTNAVVGQ
jgi:hypothetical protein